MKKPSFLNDTLYHIYNRGVEKRTVFLDQHDYFRFVHSLYEFNDKAPAQNIYYKSKILKSNTYEVQPRKSGWHGLKEKLVDIIAFCLMPNHFHIFLRQSADNGIIKFMQKLGTGYTMYFNKKYERVGALFQGRFKASLIDNHSHFLYLPHYIHLNPIKSLKKERSATDVQNIFRSLMSYRWSSYLDYIGKKNFPSLLSLDLIKELYGTNQEYKKSLTEWLRESTEDDMREIVFEE